MITTQDIINQLNKFAPFDIAEEWDNSGLQAGNPDWKVNRIIIGLDVSLPLMKAAVKTGSDLVLTHHPLLMNPEKQFNFSQMPGSAIEICAKNNISIVSAHTNLDKAHAGLNDYFARKIGLTNITGFMPDTTVYSDHEEYTGIGRIGFLPTDLSLAQFGRHIKDTLNLDYIRITGSLTQKADRIAVCTGSGGSLVDFFLNSDADVYVTGDIKYHEARNVEAASKGLIDVGHFGSERIAVDLLYEKLGQAFSDAGLSIELIRFKNEKDPFTIV